ncbi:MAG: hypothetical protein R2758_14220 [Bacteroidales bacterium]
MRKMLFLLSAAVVLSLQVTLPQHSSQIPQLMDKSRDLTMSGNIQSITLTITERNGAVRTRKLDMITKSYDDGTIRRMINSLIRLMYGVLPC